MKFKCNLASCIVTYQIWLPYSRVCFSLSHFLPFLQRGKASRKAEPPHLLSLYLRAAQTLEHVIMARNIFILSLHFFWLTCLYSCSASGWCVDRRGPPLSSWFLAAAANPVHCTALPCHPLPLPVVLHPGQWPLLLWCYISSPV